MDKRGFGYDGFFDKITTHGRSHLSLLRESYQKNNLKKKITAVNLKVSFIASFCLFFFFWLLSFLLFVKSRWETTIFLHVLLSSSFLSSTHIKSLSFCFSIFHSSLCSTYIFFLPLTSLYVPLTSKISKFVSYILVFSIWSLNGSWAGSWAFCLFAFLSSTLLYVPLTSFFFHLYLFMFHLHQKYQNSYHTFLSSLFGPPMDLGLDLGLSASLYISSLRISATCCVSWTNKLFGKASPINGFGVSLPATV